MGIQLHRRCRAGFRAGIAGIGRGRSAFIGGRRGLCGSSFTGCRGSFRTGIASTGLCFAFGSGRRGLFASRSGWVSTGGLARSLLTASALAFGFLRLFPFLLLLRRLLTGLARLLTFGF